MSKPLRVQSISSDAPGAPIKTRAPTAPRPRASVRALVSEWIAVRDREAEAAEALELAEDEAARCYPPMPENWPRGPYGLMKARADVEKDSRLCLASQVEQFNELLAAFDRHAEVCRAIDTSQDLERLRHDYRSTCAAVDRVVAKVLAAPVHDHKEAALKLGVWIYADDGGSENGPLRQVFSFLAKES